MISMDGKGRCMDTSSSSGCGAASIRGRLPQAYATVAEAKTGLGAWLGFYTENAQHQSLGLSHAAANLSEGPVDMWTIGVADRLRFPPLPEQAR